MGLFQPDDLHSPHNVGGKVRRALAEGVVGWATLDGERQQYRTLLGRAWSDAARLEDPTERPFYFFLGQNPSTGDANVDDPTLWREFTATYHAHATCMIKCNLVDYRATSPFSLSLTRDPIRSEKNLATIVHYAKRAQRVILAYGNFPKLLEPYAQETLDALRSARLDFWCLGTTKLGHPRHPCRLARYPTIEQYRLPENVTYKNGFA